MLESLRRLKISTRLTMLLLLLLATNLGAGLLTVRRLDGVRVGSAAYEELKRSSGAMEIAALLDSDLHAAGQLHLALVVEPDPDRRRLLEVEARALRAHADGLFGRLLAALDDETLRVGAEDARRTWELFQAGLEESGRRHESDTVVAGTSDARGDAFAASLSSGLLARRQQRFTEQILNVVDLLSLESAQLERDLSAEGRRAVSWVGGVAALLCLVGLLLVGGITMSITRPLAALNASVRRIIHERDLSVPVAGGGRDEVGQVAALVTTMVRDLRGMSHEIKVASATVAGAVERLRASAEDQQRAVQAQVAAVRETEATAHEIRQTALVAAEKATSVLEVATRADALGGEGAVAIDHILDANAEVVALLGAMAKGVGDLVGRTDEVASITSTVKDLADSSNMLALNAAIEAVRSGEHGRGFGVVAREIRSLADQSIQATGRVRTIVGDLSVRIGAAAREAQQGAEHVNGSLSQVRVTGESLRELTDIVRRNAAAARQIAATVTQQSAGVSQLFVALTTIGAQMEDTASRIRTTNEAAGELAQLSGMLREMTGSWRL